MPAVLQTLASSELLHTGNIDTVHASTVIGQQRGQRATNNLRAVHHTDSVTEQPITVGKDGVVDVEVLEDLDVGQRGARQDALLALGFRVQEADVLVHVEDVAVAETLNILANIDDLLQVLVLPVVEDRVVDDNAVDVRVSVGAQNGLFDVVAGDFAEGVLEAAVQESMISLGSILLGRAGACGVGYGIPSLRFRGGAGMNHTPTTPPHPKLGSHWYCETRGPIYLLFLASLLRPLRIHQCSGVIVGQEADQVRRLLEGLEPLLDLLEQAIGDVLGQHHLAGGRGGGCWGRHGDWYNFHTRELGE